MSSSLLLSHNHLVASSKDQVIFGGIYDNRFLIKKTPSTDRLGLKEVIPYPSSKGMYLLDSENPNEIKDIILDIYNDLR